MPLDELLMFRTAARNVPLKDWLDRLEVNEPGAYAKCLDLINYLNEFGPEHLSQPRSEMMRNGIAALRAKKGRVRYRILFFFCGLPGVSSACMSHGFTKGGKGGTKDPNAEIDIAIANRKLVLSNRGLYTADWEE